MRAEFERDAEKAGELKRKVGNYTENGSYKNLIPQVSQLCLTLVLISSFDKART